MCLVCPCKISARFENMPDLTKSKGKIQTWLGLFRGDYIIFWSCKFQYLGDNKHEFFLLLLFVVKHPSFQLIFLMYSFMLTSIIFYPIVGLS
jgi:hypothetical protein